MKESEGLGWWIRNGVVVRDDHLNAQGFGSSEGGIGSHAVIHRDQQLHSFVMELLHHAHIEAIAVVHAARDCCDWFGPEWFECANQQGSAGHAVGVVITADGDGFTLLAGASEAINRHPEIWKMTRRWR